MSLCIPYIEIATAQAKEGLAGLKRRGDRYPVIVVALGPRHQAQECEDLRCTRSAILNSSSMLYHAERHPCTRPQQHHGRLEAVRMVPPVVGDDLRDELPGREMNDLSFHEQEGAREAHLDGPAHLIDRERKSSARAHR